MGLFQALALFMAAVCALGEVPPAQETAREITVDWPELLGPVNRPDTRHLFMARDYYTSKVYQSIANSSSLWSTLWALTKCTPDGAWIKSMFNNPTEIKGGDEGIASVVLFRREGGSGDLVPFTAEVSITNIEDHLSSGAGIAPETVPMWPFALAEAAYSAGWRPDSQDMQAAELLQLFTGYATASAMPGPSKEDLWDIIGNADNEPVLTRHDTDACPWKVVTSANRELEQFDYYRTTGGGLTIASEEEIDSFLPDEIVTLIGFDGFKGRPH